MPRKRLYNPPELYAISRIREPRTRTWCWRVAIHRKGRYSAKKSFTDLKYGGTKKALLAARAFRDQALEKYPPLSKVEFCTRLRQNNTSGYPGVFLVRLKGKLIAFEARTQLPSGKQLIRAYSLREYSAEQARKLAIAERQRQLQQVHGYFLHSPAGRIITEAIQRKKRRTSR